jgi:multiple sugar transport system substrate-binding protein
VAAAGTGVGAAALAACGAAGEPPAAGSGLKPGEVAALDVAWENTVNLMGQFVIGPAKDLFEQRHPQIKLNFVSQAGNLEKLVTLFAGGTPPDVVFLQLVHLAALAARGIPQPIDGLMSRDRTFDPKDFQRNMWEAAGYQGKQWGIAREGGPTVLYFNRELFQAAGVPFPQDDWTWERWREAAARLTKAGGEQWGALVPGWHPFVWSNGGDILNKDLTACVLDAEPAVEGLQFRQDLTFRYQVAPRPGETGGLNNMQLFMQGKAAMFPGLRSAGNTEGFVQPWVDVALFPKGKTGRWFQMPGNAVGVGSQTKYPEAAWEVAKWLTSTEFQKLHYKQGIGGVVARNSTLRSEEYLTSAIPRKWNEYFARGQEDLRRWPPTPKWPDAQQVIDADLGPLNQGQANARTVTAALVPKVNALLRG